MVDVSKIRTDWEDVSEADWQVNSARAQANRLAAEPLNALGLGVIEALSQSGTSGSLIVLTSSLTTIPTGTTEGELIGYRNSSASAITVAGETLESGDWGVWGWFDAGWVLLNKAGSEGGIIVPDETPPTAGTLAASDVTDTSFTLTVTGAADDEALHAQPYDFSLDGGTTWEGWQTSPIYAATASPVTTYSCRHRVRDAANNTALGTTISVTTTSGPPDIFDDFAGAADGTPMNGRVTPVGGATWSVAGGSPNALIYGEKYAPTAATSNPKISFSPTEVMCSAVVDRGVGPTGDIDMYLRDGTGATLFLLRTVAATGNIRLYGPAFAAIGSNPLGVLSSPAALGLGFDGTDVIATMDGADLYRGPRSSSLAGQFEMRCPPGVTMDDIGVWFL